MVTSLILNWKRSKNVHKIIEVLRDQTIKPKIFVWDNSNSKENFNADVVIKSSKNFICWPRWIMTALTDTRFIFTHDDDFFFVKRDVIEKCVRNYKGGILGITGVVLTGDYWESRHVNAGKEDLKVDIVKGRFMFMDKKELENVNIIDNQLQDDIYVSSKVREKVIPAFLADSWQNIPDVETVALSGMKNQRENRQEAARKWFPGCQKKK